MKLDRAFDFLHHQLATRPRADCLAARQGNHWQALSTAEVAASVDRLSLGLIRLGIERGDKVAIAADSSISWTLVDLALQQVGAISVPIYPTATLDDARYILTHAEVKLAFAGSPALTRKLAEALGKFSCPIYGLTDFDDAPSWRQIDALGRDEDRAMLAERRDAIGRDDVFTIIYTSGTTGRAKGVLLSHGNVVSDVLAVDKHCRTLNGSQRALSFLPQSHIFERAGVLYYLYTGTGVYFSSVDGLSSAMQEVKPHTFSAVPRVLEKVYERLHAKEKELSGLQRCIYRRALRLAEHYEPNATPGPLLALQLALAKKLVFSKWRAAMGGELMAINVGSAALQPRLARLFWACGVTVSEGYGMTESSPALTANPFNAKGVRIGSVGVPLDGVEFRLADDGEILVRGPMVMQGYYKEPELTAETLRDGWLHTGDIGVFEHGYLRITDRKKEMFKTSNGKYIAPQVIENKLKESAFIDQIMVVGDGQKFAAALIVPLFAKLKEWCIEQGIAYTSDGEMARNPMVQALIDREVKRFNRYFGHWEHVKKFALLDRPWCVDSGELAPTLKLRRKVIVERCRDEIARLYAPA
ncbi:long-chain fatty acid--CoA ligase [Neisseriaceae bacterium JH1-16]|nr:long-chain fatty acid--CoA ligase [Neisseriaceae bacterium JH1-16]